MRLYCKRSIITPFQRHPNIGLDIYDTVSEHPKAFLNTHPQRLKCPNSYPHSTLAIHKVKYGITRLQVCGHDFHDEFLSRGKFSTN